MSSETLREAARLMRARAEAAETPAPWRIECDYLDVATGEGGAPMVLHSDAVGNSWYATCDVQDGDAEHIASWHPAVALAVADWLEREAAAVGARDAADVSPHALAVAKAYLGDP